MKPIENNEMDRLIRNALASDQSLNLPSGIAVRAIQKLEKRALLRRLFVELFSKIGLVILTLVILTGVLTGVNGPDNLERLAALILAHKELLASGTILVLAILLIDQIILKYYQWKTNMI